MFVGSIMSTGFVQLCQLVLSNGFSWIQLLVIQLHLAIL